MRSAALALRFAVVLAAGAIAAPGASTAPQPPPLRAGAARLDITGWLGLSINGGMRDRIAGYVHDPLSVRAFVLEAGGEKIALAIADSCMLPREVTDPARKRAQELSGVPADNVLVAATHAHSCPAAAGVFQSDPDPEYRRFLVRRIGDAVACAARNLAPAQVGWGRGSLPDHVFNRRWFLKGDALLEDPFGRKRDRVRMNPPRGSPELLEPAGPTDPEVFVLSLEDIQGRPLGLLANYALHYVGGTGGDHISADYFGAFARRIEAALGDPSVHPPFVAALSNGASGDINNIDFRRPAPRRRPYEQIEQVAADLAREVERVLAGIEYSERVVLASRAAALRLGVRKPAPEEVAQAKAILASAPKPLRTLKEIYARETVLLAAYPDEVEIVLQALRIGDAAIVAIPCEVFVEIGLELKKRSPFKATAIVELANGYHGYLPTRRHHELGGYETWRARSSYLELGAAEKIAERALALLEELAAAVPRAQSARK